MESNLPPQPPRKQPARQETTEPIGALSSAYRNQHSRPQWIADFIMSQHGFRRVARRNHIGEELLAEEMREQLILGGALERVRRPRRAS